MNRQEAIKIIKESLIRAIQLTGNRAFDLSQQRVPVVTGALKRSGSGKNIENGFIINYSQDYASFPERGVPAGIRYVPAYRRKDGTIVKAYSYYSRGQVAQRYIGRSMNEAFKESGDFARNFESELKSSGVKVSKA
jgi:hypothetical protein